MFDKRFNNITSIKSFDELKDPKKNENKEYIILFFYWNSCGACKVVTPVVCDVIQNNLKPNFNSKIIKVHIEDLDKDDYLQEFCSKGVPAFSIFKKNKDNYVLYDIKNDNYNYSTIGFAPENYTRDKKYLSTKNTLIDWIEKVNNNNTKENYNKIEHDDGSGYSNIKLQKPQKSFNKIINDTLSLRKNY